MILTKLIAHFESSFSMVREEPAESEKDDDENE